MELDQLYKRLNYPLEQRLGNLVQYSALIDQRDDLYLELVTLYNLTGQFRTAYDLIMARQFHPWKVVRARLPGSMYSV
jgi:hypothetical protein